MDKILIIDDDESITQLVHFMFTREGFDINIIENGKNAILYLSQDTPVSLIILDLMMPYVDGFQVLKKIKSMEKRKNIPIIILSAKNSGPDIVKALEMGANDYVQKPFNWKELMIRAKRLLN